MSDLHQHDSINLGHEALPAQRNRIAPGTNHGYLTDLLDTMEVGAGLASTSDQRLTIPIWRVKEEAALFHEGSPADHLCIVRSGHFKSVKSSEDGYHQVLSFAGRGEILGFDSICGRRQKTSALALETSTVFALSTQELNALRQESSAFDHALQLLLSRQLDRASDITELMAATAADTRLARFLVWVSARTAHAGESAVHLSLSMCRRDIASLMGVANETVSRSFANLSDAGYVRVINRDVDILDLDALKERARCTRGWAEHESPNA